LSAQAFAEGPYRLSDQKLLEIVGNAFLNKCNQIVGDTKVNSLLQENHKQQVDCGKLALNMVLSSAFDEKGLKNLHENIETADGHLKFKQLINDDTMYSANEFALRDIKKTLGNPDGEAFLKGSVENVALGRALIELIDSQYSNGFTKIK